MLNIIKQNPMVTEVFARGRKPDFSLVLIVQFYFAVPINVRQNSTHYIIKKIWNKKELQQITFNYSLDIDFEDFMNCYEKCIVKP